MNQLVGVILVFGGIYGIMATKNDWAIKISPEKTKLGRYIMNDILDENTARAINYLLNASLIAFGIFVLLGIVDFTASA